VLSSLDLEKDGRGRVKVDPLLQSVTDSQVFVLGDNAAVEGKEGRRWLKWWYYYYYYYYYCYRLHFCFT